MWIPLPPSFNFESVCASYFLFKLLDKVFFFDLSNFLSYFYCKIWFDGIKKFIDCKYRFCSRCISKILSARKRPSDQPTNWRSTTKVSSGLCTLTTWTWTSRTKETLKKRFETGHLIWNLKSNNRKQATWSPTERSNMQYLWESQT